jgi:hypothetical protein
MLSLACHFEAVLREGVDMPFLPFETDYSKSAAEQISHPLVNSLLGRCFCFQKLAIACIDNLFCYNEIVLSSTGGFYERL